MYHYDKETEQSEISKNISIYLLNVGKRGGVINNEETDGKNGLLFLDLLARNEGINEDTFYVGSKQNNLWVLRTNNKIYKGLSIQILPYYSSKAFSAGVYQSFCGFYYKIISIVVFLKQTIFDLTNNFVVSFKIIFIFTAFMLLI